MKKILILTCSTGEGHNSAARAIETALSEQGVACELADPVSFQSSRTQTVVSTLYNDTIRKVPAVFGAVYKLGDFYCSTRLPSPVYWANSRYADALKTYILENEFDAVICTHLYGMEAMTAIKKDPDFCVPCFGVMTDYVCIPFLEETRLDGYFVPMEEAKERLTSRGIPEECIVVTGIPVSPVFGQHPDKLMARKKLGIPEDKQVYLVMTGGVGCENMESLCRKLEGQLESDELMLVLTGRNQALKERLDAAYPDQEKVRTVPFTRQVNLYMAASDVLLSKPGGLSSTEAAVSNIPMVIVHAIPGCETYNAKFYTSHGMALYADTEEQAVADAKKLTGSRELSEQMIAQQKKYVFPNAARRIAEEVTGVCITKE